MKKIFEYRGQNRYIRTSGKCFIKCIKYFTKKRYTEDFKDFFEIEKDRSGVMTSAGIQAFCRKYTFNIGCFNAKEITPRNITQKSTPMFEHNNHFCLIWKSQNFGFSQAIKD